MGCFRPETARESAPEHLQTSCLPGAKATLTALSLVPPSANREQSTMAGKWQQCVCSFEGKVGFPLSFFPVPPVMLLGKCKATVRSRAEATGSWEDTACGIFECGEGRRSRARVHSAPCSSLWKGKTELWCPSVSRPLFRLCPWYLGCPTLPLRNPGDLAGKGGRAVAPQRDELLGPSSSLQPSDGNLRSQKAPWDSPKLGSSTLAFPQPSTFSGASAVRGPCGAEGGGGCLRVAPQDEAGGWPPRAVAA